MVVKKKDSEYATESRWYSPRRNVESRFPVSILGVGGSIGQSRKMKLARSYAQPQDMSQIPSDTPKLRYCLVTA